MTQLIPILDIDGVLAPHLLDDGPAFTEAQRAQMQRHGDFFMAAGYEFYVPHYVRDLFRFIHFQLRSAIIVYSAGLAIRNDVLINKLLEAYFSEDEIDAVVCEVYSRRDCHKLFTNNYARLVRKYAPNAYTAQHGLAQGQQLALLQRIADELMPAKLLLLQAQHDQLQAQQPTTRNVKAELKVVQRAMTVLRREQRMLKKVLAEPEREQKIFTNDFKKPLQVAVNPAESGAPRNIKNMCLLDDTFGIIHQGAKHQHIQVLASDLAELRKMFQEPLGVQRLMALWRQQMHCYIGMLQQTATHMRDANTTAAKALRQLYWDDAGKAVWFSERDWYQGPQMRQIAAVGSRVVVELPPLSKPVQVHSVVRPLSAAQLPAVPLLEVPATPSAVNESEVDLQSEEVLTDDPLWSAQLPVIKANF